MALSDGLRRAGGDIQALKLRGNRLRGADAAALLSGNVAAEGRVRVLLQNVGAVDLKLPESTLRVVVHQFV